MGMDHLKISMASYLKESNDKSIKFSSSIKNFKYFVLIQFKLY